MSKEELKKQVEEKLAKASDEYNAARKNEQENRADIKLHKDQLLQQENDKREAFQKSLLVETETRKSNIEQWHNEFKEATKAGDTTKIQQLLAQLKK